jgi:hypothetical protein
VTGVEFPAESGGTKKVSYIKIGRDDRGDENDARGYPGF